ncbi:hypothetical protein CHF27_010760 [Romboutsia maritimum]|uniref:Chitin-binding type-3 domain-containing protein n=1 Tax=Romboutsia maritimum TaxID=2020948 RepID=A0A371IR72_9FIRM|nr:carbohydrate-binding protein [Romboutsia maritimum]RDY22978.1 hypothetical protein CHF27_010760 [Romboutsia maritimum]
MKSRRIYALAAATILTIAGTNSVSAATKVETKANNNYTVNKVVNLTETKLSKVTKWKSNTKYFVGDKIVYNGNIYICKVDHSRLSPTIKYVWNKVEIPKWEKSTKYSVGDIVMYENKVYECKVDHSKLSPTTTYVWENLN